MWKPTRATAIVVPATLLALLASSCAFLPGLGYGQWFPETVAVGVQASKPGVPINESLLGADGPGSAGSVGPLRPLGLAFERADVGLEESYNGQPVYNCSTGAWNPINTDTRVNEIRAEGATPLLIIDYTPPCLASNVPSGGNPNYAPPDATPSTQAKWDALVKQMATHEILDEGVRIFEVWNEPDGLFWSGGLNGYLHLYQDTATVLEQVAQQYGVALEVGGPALADVDKAWLQPFFKYVQANDLPLDFVSWHWYANDPDVGPGGFLPNGLCLVTNPSPAGVPCYYNPDLHARTYGNQVTEVKNLLAGYPGLHPLTWIDEWNVNAEYDVRMTQSYGAAFAAAVLDSMQSSGLDRSCFYNAWNLGNGSAPAVFGLLQGPDNTPQPVYYAFEYYHDLAGASLPVTLSPDQSGMETNGRVGAIASSTLAGGIHVLIYNFMPYSLPGNYGTTNPNPYYRTVSLNLTGLAHGTSYTWNRSLTDNAHTNAVVASGNTQGNSATITFQLPAEGVTLLSLTPTAS